MQEDAVAVHRCLGPTGPKRQRVAAGYCSGALGRYLIFLPLGKVVSKTPFNKPHNNIRCCLRLSHLLGGCGHVPS